MLTMSWSLQMMEQQEAEDGIDSWERGLSNVELLPDGSIKNLRSSFLMPVAEDKSFDDGDEESVSQVDRDDKNASTALNPLDVYPPELRGNAQTTSLDGPMVLSM